MKIKIGLVLVSVLLCCAAFIGSVSAYYGYNNTFLIAKKREVMLPPPRIRPTCTILKTEEAKNRKLYTEFNNKKRRDIIKVENNLKLDFKRIQTSADVAKNGMVKRTKSYKTEEVKPISDTFNASVDAALTTYKTTIDKVFSIYKTNVTKSAANAIRGIQRNYASLKRNVCSGNPEKEKGDSGYYSGYREGHGVGISEFRTIIIEAGDAFNVAKGKAYNVFKTALKNAEKTKNDSLKPLKKVK